MPKCNSVLQTENDLFQREIRPNLSENCHFSTFFRPPKSSKTNYDGILSSIDVAGGGRKCVTVLQEFELNLYTVTS